MPPVTPNAGTGSTDTLASVDAAMGAWQDPDEQDDQNDAGDGASDTDQQDGDDQDPDVAEPDDGTDDYDFADTDGDPGDDPDGSDPDASKGDGLAADTLKVKLDDGTETTVAELKRGNLRQADYSKKTEMLAREKDQVVNAGRQLESQATELHKARETIAVLATLLQPKQPDASLLESGDYAGYELQKRAFEDQTAAINELLAQDGVHRQRIEAAAKGRKAQRMQGEWKKLATSIPEFADPKTGAPTERYNQFWKAVEKAGDHYGFTASEITDKVPAWGYLVLRDALAYRRIKAQAGKTAQDGTKRQVIRGGKPSQLSPEQQAAAAARDKLKGKRSLSLKEAMALI